MNPSEVIGTPLCERYDAQGRVTFSSETGQCSPPQRVPLWQQTELQVAAALLLVVALASFELWREQRRRARIARRLAARQAAFDAERRARAGTGTGTSV